MKNKPIYPQDWRMNLTTAIGLRTTTFKRQYLTDFNLKNNKKPPDYLSWRSSVMFYIL